MYAKHTIAYLGNSDSLSVLLRATVFLLKIYEVLSLSSNAFTCWDDEANSCEFLWARLTVVNSNYAQSHGKVPLGRHSVAPLP